MQLDAPAIAPTTRTTWGVGVDVAAGAFFAALGLLPWIVTGMRLPLQNLWATSSLDMPVALLPFSQYALTLIVGVLVTGAALAGGFARLTRHRRNVHGLVAIVSGVAVVHAVAIAQTAIVVGGGLLPSTTARLYLVALTGGSAAASAVGLAVLILLARGGRAAALLATALAAIPSGAWLNGLILPSGTEPFIGEAQVAMLAEARWIPAILVGLAIAWCGVDTVARGAAVATSLVVLWLVPALFTAVSVAAGTRVYAGDPRAMLEFGLEIFVSASGRQSESLHAVGLALCVAALGFVLRVLLDRRAGRVVAHS